VSGVDSLEQVAKEVRACTACQLHLGRKNAVPGEGAPGSDLMFIGEGPGFHENEQGRPFVGAAGRFLEELLANIHMTREQVFIGNVIKCRPPGNRDPQLDEIQACSNFLDRQIRIINPKVIITLGRFSMARFFPKARISSIHGQAKWVQGRLIVAMYHPAAALHQPSLREVVRKDFSRLTQYIEQAGDQSPSQEEPPTDPQQLSMF
jgi:uracil-DNA glycosylase family 4